MDIDLHAIFLSASMLWPGFSRPTHEPHSLLARQSHSSLSIVDCEQLHAVGTANRHKQLRPCTSITHPEEQSAIGPVTDAAEIGCIGVARQVVGMQTHVNLSILRRYLDRNHPIARRHCQR